MSAPPRGERAPGCRWVQKRDGREVPFDKAKIARAVRAAQAATGEQEGDADFGAEVADLVELELSRRHARSLEIAPEGAPRGPHIEEIQDLVERVLIELGRARLAKAYILYRDRRSRAREALSVEVTPELAARARTLEVRQAAGTSPWSKGRLASALVDETGLPRSTAEEVAGRVEQRLLRSGLRRVSSVLVRELVAAELVGLGLGAALLRHEPLLVPRHEVRRLLAAGPGAGSEGGAAHGAGPSGEGSPGEEGAALAATAGTAATVEGTLAAAVLAPYALDSIFEQPAPELHLEGDLELLGLEAPHRHLALCVPAELLVRGRPGVRAAFELLEELARLAPGVSRALVVEAAGPTLQPLVRGARVGSTSALSSWLIAMGALARATGLDLGLSRIGLRSAALLARLVEELDRVASRAEPGARVPALYVDAEELSALASEQGPARACTERLLAGGVLRPTFAPAGGGYAGPGCVRRGAEQGALALGGAVALNLARVARRAGPWREDLCLERLAELARSSVEALSSLARFQQGATAARGGRLRARVAHALVPVGLVEALSLLGDGEVRPAQGARLLGLLSEAAERFSAQAGTPLALDTAFGEGAARRFALLDARGETVRQPLLFAFPRQPGGAPREGEPYSSSLSLGPAVAGEPGAAEGELLSTVPAGVLARGVLARAPSPLDAWERFHARREATRRAEREHLLLPRPTAARRPATPLFEPAPLGAPGTDPGSTSPSSADSRGA